MATKASTAALRRIGQGHTINQRRAARHPVGEEERVRKQESSEVRFKSKAKSEKLEGDMSVAGIKLNKIVMAGLVGTIAGAMAVAPVAAARSASERISDTRVIDRASLENLQRWVSAGHADWCKDARLVAAEELWRLAPDFSGDGFELNAASGDSAANGGNRVTFEWAPPDGGAIYRVTVERFEWLLPIAKNTQSIVWVPTSTGIHVNE